MKSELFLKKESIDSFLMESGHIFIKFDTKETGYKTLATSLIRLACKLAGREDLAGKILDMFLYQESEFAIVMEIEREKAKRIVREEMARIVFPAGECEECKQLTHFQVAIIDRWAFWCGCK